MWIRRALAICTGAAGVTYAVLSQENKGKLLASWTTGYTPSVKWDSDWDRRDPKSLVKPLKGRLHDDKDVKDHENQIEKATSKATRHLIFIRHGQYVMNDTDEERYLTELGREQAQLSGQRLKELNFPYDKIVYSTMTRATETAKLISKYLPNVPMEKCDLIREGAPIPPEPPTSGWRPSKAQFHEDGSRIEAGFRKHVHRAPPEQEKDSYEVYVCHANVIRYFVMRALQLPPEAWLRLSLHNASLTFITIRPSGRVSVRGVGDSGHIPPDKLTTN